MLHRSHALVWLAALALTSTLALRPLGAEEGSADSASSDKASAASETLDDGDESNDDGASGAHDAEAIIGKALETNSIEFESGRAELTLTVEGNNGDTSERKMVVKSAELGGSVRTRIELTAPADVEGQTFLFAENPDGADDVWMYVPAFSVTRRIEGSKKQGSFLGSHFTYNDLESRSLEAADYDRTGEDEVAGHDVHVIEATPREGVESAYGKTIAYIRQSDRAPLKFEFFDEDDELVKTLFVEQLAETDAGAQYIKQMKMQSEKGGYSRIAINSVESSADLPTSIFNREQLGD